MTRVLANHEDLAMASDDFALVAHFLTEGRTFISQFLSVMRSLLYTNVQPQTLLPRFGEENPRFPLLEAVRDTPAIQVVDGQLDRDLVAREDLDVVHTHLA